MGRGGALEDENKSKNKGGDDGLSPPLKRLKTYYELGGGREEATVSDLITAHPPAMARTLPEPDSDSAPSSSPEDGEALVPVAVAANGGGQPSTAIAATLGPKGLIHRSEFTRVIAQALQSLGYPRSAALLQEESGVRLEPPSVAVFRRQILAKEWDGSLATLAEIPGLEPPTAKAATFLILQDKFMHQLKSGDPLAALKTLRTQIAPLKIHKKRLHTLASCIVCSSETDLAKTRKNVEGLGSGKPEAELLDELQTLFPPSVMIPQNRLEDLVEQALVLQREACVFHNSSDTTLSLYSNHQCSRDQIPTRTVQVLDKHKNEVWFLQFSHNGKYLASASKDNSAFIWEITSNNVVTFKYALKSHQKPVSLVAWSPDDTMLLTCGNEEVVKLWDVSTGQCKHTFNEPNGNFTACAWFRDGIVTGGPDKYIRLWSVTEMQLRSWMVMQAPRVNDLIVSSDGKHLISVCEKEIRIYNFETKMERLIVEDKGITSLTVSKDGNFLLINLVNEEIHLWDIVSQPKLLSKYKGHLQTRYVIRSCFGGSDQAFIVSGSEDSQVYIWHRATGDLLEVLPGHSGTVNSVSWNPVNPHMFASASDDHTIRIWGLNTDA